MIVAWRIFAVLSGWFWREERQRNRRNDCLRAWLTFEVLLRTSCRGIVGTIAVVLKPCDKIRRNRSRGSSDCLRACLSLWWIRMKKHEQQRILDIALGVLACLGYSKENRNCRVALRSCLQGYLEDFQELAYDWEFYHKHQESLDNAQILGINQAMDEPRLVRIVIGQIWVMNRWMSYKSQESESPR